SGQKQAGTKSPRCSEKNPAGQTRTNMGKNPKSKLTSPVTLMKSNPWQSHIGFLEIPSFRVRHFMRERRLIDLHGCGCYEQKNEWVT
ncbi:MAG: hypothetical protein LBD43_02745, partial [Holosporales bacterium]|nr:hypothetical protein [Holosporales bacterium]